MTDILIEIGDITKIEDCEAIVNAANIALSGGGGVDGAIHYGAGIGLSEECATLGGCNVGEAKITGGYNLPAKYVIHTVGPKWKGGKYMEKEFLASCYKNSLKLAMDNGIRSIAFPSIATGIYRFPVAIASEIAVKTAYEFANEYPDAFDLIKFVLYEDKYLEHYEIAQKRNSTNYYN